MFSSYECNFTAIIVNNRNNVLHYKAHWQVEVQVLIRIYSYYNTHRYLYLLTTDIPNWKFFDDYGCTIFNPDYSMLKIKYLASQFVFFLYFKCLGLSLERPIAICTRVNNSVGCKTERDSRYTFVQVVNGRIGTKELDDIHLQASLRPCPKYGFLIGRMKLSTQLKIIFFFFFFFLKLQI